jgi:L-alanine-DL-glutamate epimerase-like enolase superfamily enzyme
VTDPRQHQAHELPLADRLVTDRIRRWLTTALETELAGYGEATPEERAARAAVKQMRHLALADYSYALVPQILDDLRRAGLLNDQSPAT